MIAHLGSTKHFEYDSLIRIKSITAKDPTQNVLLNVRYSFDKMGNIVGSHGKIMMCGELIKRRINECP